MLKIKNIIICVALQLITFLLLFILIVMIGERSGGLENSNYFLSLEISSYISVIIAGFFGARIAWDRGGLYALVMASFWVFVRLGITCYYESELNYQNVIIKSSIIILAGFLSGVMGVAKKNTKYI